MLGLMPLRSYFPDQTLFRAIECAASANIPLFVYTAPLEYREDLGTTVQHTVSGPRLKSSLTQTELNSLNKRRMGFYPVSPPALLKIALDYITEIGEVDVNFPECEGEEARFFYSPYCSILQASNGVNKEMLCVLPERYRTENLLILSKQINLIRDLLGMEKVKTIEWGAKRKTNESSIIDDYSKSKSGENTRASHEAIIEFLFNKLEADAQAGNVPPHSILQAFIKQETGTLNINALAESINDESGYYFGTEKGFKVETLRKRISSIRSKFGKYQNFT